MKTAFRDQLEALLPRLRRFALGLTADPDEADDLVQAACERALRKQHQWQPGTRLDSWMYRIIQTLRIDGLRRDKHKPTSIEAMELPEQADGQSEGRAEREDLLTKAAAMIEALPDEQRAVMLLVVVEEKPYAEVAELLGVPKGTVMSRLFRARSRLQALLQERGELRERRELRERGELQDEAETDNERGAQAERDKL